MNIFDKALAIAYENLLVIMRCKVILYPLEEDLKLLLLDGQSLSALALQGCSPYSRASDLGVTQAGMRSL